MNKAATCIWPGCKNEPKGQTCMKHWHRLKGAPMAGQALLDWIEWEITLNGNR